MLKAGVWYLVARRDGELRTYRVSRVDEVSSLDEHFERPADFDLARFWGETVAQFESNPPEVEVVVLASRVRVRGAGTHGARSRPGAPCARARGRGAPRCVFAFESFDDAYGDCMWLGADVEVLEPEALRTRIAETATALHELYAAAPDAASAGREVRGDVGHALLDVRAVTLRIADDAGARAGTWRSTGRR